MQYVRMAPHTPKTKRTWTWFKLATARMVWRADRFERMRARFTARVGHASQTFSSTFVIRCESAHPSHLIQWKTTRGEHSNGILNFSGRSLEACARISHRSFSVRPSATTERKTIISPSIFSPKILFFAASWQWHDVFAMTMAMAATTTTTATRRSTMIFATLVDAMKNSLQRKGIRFHFMARRHHKHFNGCAN